MFYIGYYLFDLKLEGLVIWIFCLILLVVIRSGFCLMVVWVEFEEIVVEVRVVRGFVEILMKCLN